MHEERIDWPGSARMALSIVVNVEEGAEIAKDQKEYPGFDQGVVMDLRTSLDLFAESIVWSEKSDYRQLLLGDTILMNERLAQFYGQKVEPGAGFQPVKMDAADRAGVLTHPYVLATFSYTKSTSPIHRGVFLTRNILGRIIPSHGGNRVEVRIQGRHVREIVQEDSLGIPVVPIANEGHLNVRMRMLLLHGVYDIENLVAGRANPRLHGGGAVHHEAEFDRECVDHLIRYKESGWRARVRFRQIRPASRGSA